MPTLIESIRFATVGDKLICHLAGAADDARKIHVLESLLGEVFGTDKPMTIAGLPGGYKEINHIVVVTNEAEFENFAKELSTSPDMATKAVMGMVMDFIYSGEVKVNDYFATPVGVVEAFCRNRKVHVEDCIIYTPTGVITPPAENLKWRELVSKYTANGTLAMGSGGSLSDELETLGNMLAETLTAQAEDRITYMNLKRLTGCKAELPEAKEPKAVERPEPTEYPTKDFAAGSLKAQPPRLNRSGVEQAATAKQSFQPTELYKIDAILGLCYVGQGMVGNSATGEVYVPVMFNDRLVYEVEHYLGIENNTVHFPYEMVHQVLGIQKETALHRVVGQNPQNHQRGYGGQGWGSATATVNQTVAEVLPIGNVQWWRKA